MPGLPDIGPVATVLLVDANAEERRLTADVLTVAGMRVIELEEGRLAVERAGADLPDLIVLDIRIEGVDGLELCRRLRAAPWTAATPLVILSGQAGGSDQALGLEAGADDYVAKPFNVRELVARVRGLLRRRWRSAPTELWATRRSTPTSRPFAGSWAPAPRCSKPSAAPATA